VIDSNDAVNNPKRTEVGRIWIVRVGYGVVAAIGLKLGFDFGDRVAGAPFGVLMAVNAAVFGAILFSIVAGKLLRSEAAHDKKP
jgi:hypothetical protein